MTNEQVKVLLNKEYSGESIIDAERDLYESVNHADDIPQDEYGFPQGTFTITVTFTPDVSVNSREYEEMENKDNDD